MCESTQTTELKEARRNAARSMKRLLTHFRTQMDDGLRPFGVTKAQIQLLVAIRNAPGSSGAHVARLCEVTPQTVQGLLERAEESGWIVRAKDSVNDRIITASLTPAGDELLVAAERVVGKIETKLWAGIPEDEIKSVNQILEKCLQNIA